MKVKSLRLFSSFSSIATAVVAILGITSAALASGGAMFNPGSLSIKSGAPLAGVTSHSQITDCGACHASPWGTETMSDQCLKCHTGISAQLSQPTSLHSVIRFNEPNLNCRSCHTEHHGPTASLTRIPPGWNPHDQLGFSLKSHRLRMDGTPFECKDCHANGYTAPFDQRVCADCHLKVNQAFAQEHILTFWTDCVACHDGLDSHGSKFDHSQVSFKLIGIHSLIACSKCHDGARKMSDLQTAPQDCYACHQKDDSHAGQFGTKCGICHTPEGWKKSAQFDHNLANFKLIGKHVSVACESCHVNRIYKGIPSDCFSCHAKDDKHNGQFGTDCGTCHSPEGWNRAVDHSKFAFHLDGKHATVACESCHKGGVFIGTPTDCVACHAKDDAHAGQLGTQCGTCHTPDNWSNATFDHNTVAFSLKAHVTKSDGTPFVCKDCHVKGYAAPFDQVACANCHLQVNQAFATEHILTFWTNCMACHDGLDSYGSKFNHNFVAFPLIGKHASAACSNCHINDRNLADLRATSQDCYTCHQKDDRHAGQLGTNCGACHTPNAWKPANVDHTKFAFHLDGKHATVACESCHVNGVFKGTPTDCGTCHAKDDAHSGQFGTSCGSCHSPDGWKPAKVDHSKLAFHLDGKHAAVACESCHINGVFKGTPTDCASCHLKKDPHGGKLGTDCASCHTSNGWTPSTFDHNRAAFLLTGKHTTATCAQCHTDKFFVGTPKDCASCHTKDDAHAGQLGNQCGACHTPNGWTPATFDHNTVSFSLKAHAAKSDSTPFACKDCHVKGYVAPFDQTVCANCHLKINQAFATKHILTFWTNCMACHDGLDSHGSNFDHSRVPFNLVGKHGQLDCAKCHDGAHSLTDLKSAPQDCVSCHAKDDRHNGQFGTNCATCHTPEGWQLAKVDHSQFAFHLDGKHAAVACESCHVNGVFKGTPTDCASCHLKKDPHGGKLGTNCASCHTPNGWIPSTFDHSRAAFLLTGKHTAIACSQCHTDKFFVGTPKDCFSCHAKNDKHNGQFGTNCESCHSPDGWKPAKVDHSKFAFHLDGKHSAVACASCHVNGVFKSTPTDCASCHLKNDPHGGKLGTNCASCHTPNGWIPSTFDHSRAAFLLTGKHAAVTCAQCHTDKFFVGTPTDCASCHIKNDPHAGLLGTQCASCHTSDGWKPSLFDHSKSIFQLTGAHLNIACNSCHKDLKFKGTPTLCYSCHASNDHHAGKYGTNCGACHSTTAWKPATFDHNLSAFKLTGAHASVNCAKCHVNGVFIGTPKDCYSCHASIDHHAGKYGTNCGACHSTSAWKPASFDHNLSAFKLTGAHASVSCTSCHANGVFTGTPKDCYSCHAKNDHHGGKYGTNCAACHSTSAWKPATFDHNLSAFKLTGAHLKVSCASCHPAGKYTGTPKNCSACHSDPTFHAGAFGLNCSSCHNTSAWKPAKFGLSHPNVGGGDGGTGINHGGASCRTCHPATVHVVTCLACHNSNNPGGGGGGD